MTDQTDATTEPTDETTPPAGRAIELEVEVAGTPEEVWRAIATGPGITSWYVPHTVEEAAGGTVTLSFGPGMETTGRVAAWEPPRRVVFDGGEEGGSGLAFEWTIEARDGGTCVVRLVNSGFGTGGPWDDHYDGMHSGWQMFLTNLQLHLAHFGGQSATPMLPMAGWAGPRSAAWSKLLTGLGVEAPPEVGQRLAPSVEGGPSLSGTVVEATDHHVTLLLDGPAPGHAFLAAEGREDGEMIEVSIWSYLYGDDRDAIAARDEDAWRTWLSGQAPAG
jgi:uncharacterized protein YndB with AHSA1/START domain